MAYINVNGIFSLKLIFVNYFSCLLNVPFVIGNSTSPGEMLHFAASQFGLMCLVRSYLWDV